MQFPNANPSFKSKIEFWFLMQYIDKSIDN